MTGPAEHEVPGLRSGQLQDEAVKGVGWTMAHTVLSIPIAFLVNLLLARALAPEGYGRLAFLTTLVSIAGSVIALGLSSAMIQFGAKAHATGDRDEVRRILSASQGFRLLVVAPALTLLVLWLIDVPPLFLVLALACGVWLPAALDGAPITLFIENKTAAGARIAMMSNLLVQAGVVIAVLWIGTADSVWATRVVLTAAGIAAALVAISPDYRRAVLRPRAPRHFPPGFWRFALPTGLASLIGELAISRTEVVFLNWLSTPEAVGLFALAFGLSGHIFAPAQALTGPLLPAVSGLREVDPGRVVDAFGRALRASSTVVAALTAAALPALSVLVPTLYGHEFAAAAPAVLVLGVNGAFMVLAGPVSTFVLARLSARSMLQANAAALCVNLVAVMTLIPALGLWGAVIANMLGGLTLLVLLVESERRDLGLTPGEVLHWLQPVFIAGLGTVLGWVVVTQVPLTALPGAVVASSISLLVLVAVMRATRCGLDRADAEAILRIAPPRLKPVLHTVLIVLVVRRRHPVD